VSWQYTQDWSPADVAEFVALCKRVQVFPMDLLACMFNESDARAVAHNVGGDAVGLIQFVPQTRKNLGFHGTWQEFVQLGVTGQLPYVERYFVPYKGKLTSVSRVYAAMFLPATLGWPGLNELTTLTSMHGPLAWAYAPNRGLDIDDKGRITLGDLGRAAARAAHGKRWDELSGRVAAAIQERTTDPELPEVGDGDGTLSETFPANDAGNEPPRGGDAA
jgi:hypothetical protein